MAISNEQKGMTLRRKLRVLRYLTNSKSVKKSSLIMDALLYIYKLKLQLEAIQKQFLDLMHHIQEVKVETIEKGLIEVKVVCKKGKDLLVPMLEVFERMNLNVAHASVTCNYNIFGMEAIVEAHDQDHQFQDILRQALTEVILKGIQI